MGKLGAEARDKLTDLLSDVFDNNDFARLINRVDRDLEQHLAPNLSRTDLAFQLLKELEKRGKRKVLKFLNAARKERPDQPELQEHIKKCIEELEARDGGTTSGGETKYRTWLVLASCAVVTVGIAGVTVYFKPGLLDFDEKPHAQEETVPEPKWQKADADLEIVRRPIDALAKPETGAELVETLEVGDLLKRREYEEAPIGGKTWIRVPREADDPVFFDKDANRDKLARWSPVNVNLEIVAPIEAWAKPETGAEFAEKLEPGDLFKRRKYGPVEEARIGDETWLRVPQHAEGHVFFDKDANRERLALWTSVDGCLEVTKNTRSLGTPAKGAQKLDSFSMTESIDQTQNIQTATVSGKDWFRFLVRADEDLQYLPADSVKKVPCSEPAVPPKRRFDDQTQTKFLGLLKEVRRNLLQKCCVHTLLRLPTGIWYSPGVKANVLFFDKKEGRAEAWTDKLWVYDLRTNQHFTLKQKPIRRSDFDEFIACYKPGRMHERAETWSEANPEGRWRCFDYDELLKRDKLTLDLFWIKDKSLTDTDNLPAPDIIAADISDDLEAALEQFTKIAARLGQTGQPHGDAEYEPEAAE